MRTGTSALAVLVAVLGACDDERELVAVLERDSAGVTIVESTGPAWRSGDEWLVGSAPSLDLATSGSGAPHEFFRVTDAMRFPDRSLVVTDRGSGEIRFFSADGSFLQSVGREGDGPGEFSRLTSVDRWRGDSLIAFDDWLGRVTVLDPDRNVARVASRSLADERVQQLHPLDGESFVAASYSLGFLAQTAGLYRMPTAIVRLLPSGELLDTVTVIPGFEGVSLPRGDARPLFGKQGHFAVHEERIYVGVADQLRYDVHAPTGALERIVRVPDYDLAVSAADLSREREAVRAGLPPGGPPRLYEFVDRLPDQETRPAYSDLIVDTEGHVWLAEFHGVADANEPTDWEVFTPRGEWLGSVRLPSRFTVFEIGVDYVLGRQFDPLDVEHVQVFVLRRG